jgi:hypothetical protein
MDYPLENNFTYHPPKEGEAKFYEMFRAKARNYARMLIAYCPKSRELSLALTKIEESVMWANAARARYEDGKPKIGNKEEEFHYSVVELERRTDGE